MKRYVVTITEFNERKLTPLQMLHGISRVTSNEVLSIETDDNIIVEVAKLATQSDSKDKQ